MNTITQTFDLNKFQDQIGQAYMLIESVNGDLHSLSMSDKEKFLSLPLDARILAHKMFLDMLSAYNTERSNP